MSSLKVTKNRLEEALEAIDAEISAVLKKPNTETLINGVLQASKSDTLLHKYQFQTRTLSLRYVEEVRWIEDETKSVLPITVINDDTIELRFEESMGARIDHLKIEWDNDFVLRKIKDYLKRLLSQEPAENLLEQVWHPERLAPVEAPSLQSVPEYINERQRKAVEASLAYPVSIIWGPPGTGKTSTLGHVVVHALDHHHSVLFVSNTNRAVDVGCLSMLQAMKQSGRQEYIPTLCRFGDPAVRDPELDCCSFDHKMIEWKEQQKQRFERLSALHREYLDLERVLLDLELEGTPAPKAFSQRHTVLLAELKRYGGLEAVEQKLEKMQSPNELSLLLRHRLICTTLAKVCTSELLASPSFDVVIIDEASMAALPYVLILASKAKKHLIFAGDPMQLPPIALTDQAEAKRYLEEDIFIRLSGADHPSSLFQWQDRHAGFITFFDTQYRMQVDVGSLISRFFYQGRLLSETGSEAGLDRFSNSLQLWDTASLSPILTQQEALAGFQPVNQTHISLVIQRLRHLLMESFLVLQDIGIIVPFRSGVSSYRTALRHAGMESVEVGTIHTFQGREKRMIIFDTMMTGMASSKGNMEPSRERPSDAQPSSVHQLRVSQSNVRHFSVRPFDEGKNGLSVIRLLNVALSRAKDLLIIVADTAHFRKVYPGKFMAQLLEEIATLQARDSGKDVP
jgi:hypothetical protein